MKRRCVCRLLALILLAALSAPGAAAYATGESKAEETSEEETGEGTEETRAPEETETDDLKETPETAEEALEEALEESSYEADEVIAQGVRIDTVDVGGMTAEEALLAVLAHVDELGKKEVVLTLEGADGVEPIRVCVSELGLHTDELSGIVMEALALGKGGNLIVRYKAEKDLQKSKQIFEIGAAVDETRVEQFVREKASGLAAEPVDAELTRKDGRFSISESKSGVRVDVPATVSAVLEAFQGWDGEELSLEAEAALVQPERSTEFLSQVQDSLGSFTASTSDTRSGKLQNLDRGVELTDGILIMPGETWSMHDALAPFSASNGYTKQVAYQSGTYAQEYGGGICQLATTLYNAALLAEIDIPERHNHSLVVYYTDFGLDATINDDGTKDLKLKNNFDFPVYIEGYHNGDGKVTYTIWGKETRPSNRTIRFYGKTLSKVSAGEQTIPDPTKPVGYRDVVQSGSYPAVVAKAYKEITVDGEVETIELHKDTYHASPRKVVIGTAVPVPEVPETVPEVPGQTPETSAPAPTPEAPAPTPEVPAPTPEAPAPEAPAPTPETPVAG